VLSGNDDQTVNVLWESRKAEIFAGRLHLYPSGSGALASYLGAARVDVNLKHCEDLAVPDYIYHSVAFPCRSTDDLDDCASRDSDGLAKAFDVAQRQCGMFQPEALAS